MTAENGNTSVSNAKNIETDDRKRYIQLLARIALIFFKGV